MDIRECYAKVGGNFEDVLGRMMNKESLVERFLLKFLDDKSLETLEKALEEGDVETAFRAAHTLKGVCGNLSLSKLGDSSTRLTDALRGLELTDEVPGLLEEVREDYKTTYEAIAEFKAQQG